MVSPAQSSARNEHTMVDYLEQLSEWSIFGNASHEGKDMTPAWPCQQSMADRRELELSLELARVDDQLATVAARQLRRRAHLTGQP